MTFLLRLWKRISQTNALDECSGRMETLFLGSVYRLIYITGLSNSDQNLAYIIYSNIVKLFYCLLLCAEIWYLFDMAWSLDAIIESVNTIVIQLSALHKYRNLIVHKEVFKKLASSMESPNFDLSSKERKKLVDVWVKRNEANLKFLVSIGTGTLVAWYIYPLVDDLEYNLMVPVYLPFDYNTPALYCVAYPMLVVVFTYISFFVMVNDLIIQAYIMHLLCQFNVLQDCFTNILRECTAEFKGIDHNKLLKDKRFRRKYVSKLRNLVNQHRLILSNTMALKKILSGPMLSQLSCSTILICSIGFQIVTTSRSQNITKCLMGLLFLGYNMFTLYIICRWCEEVTIQSKEIGVTVYCSGWENGLATIPGVRSSLLLILTRANKPLVLSGGGMYNLSLDSYANLVKTSYTALTVLLRFRHD